MAWLILAMLVAGGMPYGLTAVSKLGSFRLSDNGRTREWQDELVGWRKRAYWAHLNAFEAFPLFASAIVATLRSTFWFLAMGCVVALYVLVLEAAWSMG